MREEDVEPKRQAVFIMPIFCALFTGSASAIGPYPYENDAISNQLAATDGGPTPEYRWGPAKQGFVVSLRMDRHDYTQTMDIVLHFACRRLTDDWKLTGGAFRIRPCSPTVELRDDRGMPVPLDDERDLGNGRFMICIGGGSSGGFETLNIEAGAIETHDLILNQDCVARPGTDASGYFTMRPGRYTATAVWHAHSEDPDIEAVVRSPEVTFRIVGHEDVEAGKSRHP